MTSRWADCEVTLTNALLLSHTSLWTVGCLGIDHRLYSFPWKIASHSICLLVRLRSCVLYWSPLRLICVCILDWHIFRVLIQIRAGQREGDSPASFSTFLCVAVEMFRSSPVSIGPCDGHLSCLLFNLACREGKRVTSAMGCMPTEFVGLGASLRVCLPAVEMPPHGARCRVLRQRLGSGRVQTVQCSLSQRHSGEVGWGCRPMEVRQCVAGLSVCGPRDSEGPHLLDWP